MKKSLINKSLNRSVCENIKAMRYDFGWTQKDLAESIGISIPAFSKIESGFTDINLSRLEQIADAFGISLVQLLTAGNDEKAANSQVGPPISYVQKKIDICEKEISVLQRKVIELYEELYCKVPVAS
jgi:transcriptional regulator with XRE-family HTH domain